MAHVNSVRDTNLGTVITHTAASTGTSSSVLDTSQGRGILVLINVTAISGTSPTLTVTIKGCLDGLASATYTQLATASITTTGLTKLTIYPTIPASANAVAQDTTGVFTRIDTVIGGTGPSVTATISAQLLY